MTVDDRVRHRFETLAERVRDEIVAQGRIEADELLALAEKERAAVAADAARHARQAAEQQLAERITAALEAARVEHEQHAQAAFDEQMGRLVDGIRAIDRARSLSDVLSATAAAAARERPGTVLLLFEGTTARVWEFDGLGAEHDLRHGWLNLQPDVVAELVRSARADTFSSESARSSRHPSAPDARIVRISVDGRVVAALYTEGANDQEADRLQPVRLEMLARHAGRSLEAITAAKTAQLLANAPEIFSPAARDDVDSSLVPSRTGLIE